MKPFLTHFFRSALLVWLLTSTSAAFAQQLQPAPWNDPSVIWLTPAQAQVAVQGKLNQIEPQLADLTPGTGPHTDLLRRILFYKSIFLTLVNGSSVQQAIEIAVPEAASLGGIYEHAFTPEATLRSLYDEALALLSI